MRPVILKLTKSEDMVSFERQVNFQVDCLDSPNICHILDIISGPDHAGMDDFEATMVMKVRPWTLWDACHHPKVSSLSDHESARIMKCALRGLSDMHEQGVAHLGKVIVKPRCLLPPLTFPEIS